MTSCTVKRQGRVLRAWPLLLALLAPAAHADLQAELAKARSAPARDVPLFTLQAGVAALAEGDTAQSAQLFDVALTGIESMYANTENAARARSLWYEEGAKDFKGEPYERAMAYYYRGLLYLAEGDYENARASFRGGLLQDAFAEEQQHRADFAMLMLLEGWANQLAGERSAASDAYAEVGRLRAGWTPPGSGSNLLIVAELGGSPRKLADGISNSEIVYRRPKRTPERQATVEIGGQPHALALVEDVFMQASTRGGRPIDRVIDGKVSFQAVTGNIGSALTGIAAEASIWNAAGAGGSGNALGAVAAIGAISSVISANVKPRADVRFWGNLPETLHAATIKLDGAPENVRVTLKDADGQPVAADNLRIQSWRDKNGNGLLWIRSRN